MSKEATKLNTTLPLAPTEALSSASSSHGRPPQTELAVFEERHIVPGLLPGVTIMTNLK